MQAWHRVWQEVIPVFAFSPEIRRVIYTTNAVESLDRVIRKVVPDDLKSAVLRADRFDPGLNRTYAEMASHHGTAILPARP